AGCGAERIGERAAFRPRRPHLDFAIPRRPSLRGRRDRQALCRCRPLLPVRRRRSVGRGAGVMAKITLDNLRHSYVQNPQRPEDWALKEMSQELKDGGAYALLGPSGCGKNTLLNLVSGLLRPTQGRILFDGKDVNEATPEQRNIAQVFQFPVIYDTMTVYDNLAFPLRNRGVPAAEVDKR